MAVNGSAVAESVVATCSILLEQEAERMHAIRDVIYTKVMILVIYFL